MGKGRVVPTSWFETRRAGRGGQKRAKMCSPFVITADRLHSFLLMPVISFS